MNTLRCPFCERHCLIGEGQAGVCRMYHLADGQIRERFPHHYSSLVISHIEAVPFYHFQPGSRTFVLGGAGCNFDCHYCSNAHLARSEAEPLLVYDLPPERVVDLARQNGCHNLAFAINEPTVAWPSLREVAQAAAQAGMPFGLLTNGFMSPEVAAEMGELCAFVNVSLKAIHDDFYRQYVGVSGVEVVLRNIEQLHARTHVEVSTPLVQGVNDDDIPAIAAFIASVDRQIAWHVLRLLPEYKMANLEPPPIDDVVRRLEAERGRLPFIYFGNFVGSQWVSTLCPQCGTVVVERLNMGGCISKAVAYRLQEGYLCAQCGHPLPFAGASVAWNSEDGQR